MDRQLEAILGKVQRDNARMVAEFAELQKKFVEVLSKRSITEEIDAIPGRRIFYNWVQTQSFTSTQDGQKGAAMTFKLSQDGPFVMTSYPMAIWKVALPTTATNFGKWRPVASYPLPLQQFAATDVEEDIIDLSYEMQDSGSNRNFQDNPVPAGMFSYPGNLVELPVPTLFTPNSVVSFIPTYENMVLSASGTATTGGTLVVVLPGYRIANL